MGGEKMKLLVINPIVNTEFDILINSELQEVKAIGTEIDVISIKNGPKSISNYSDEVFAAPDIINLIIKNKDNYDGFLINCFADPGVDGAREIVDKPIIGAGEAAFFVAAMLGVPFSIITVGDNAKNKMGLRFRSIGLNRFMSATGIKEEILKIDENLHTTADLIIEESKKVMKQYGSEVILLGCTGMIKVAKLISEKSDISIIEPSTTSVKALEMLVSLNISHPIGGRYTYYNNTNYNK